jgi:hypothetical protein
VEKKKKKQNRMAGSNQYAVDATNVFIRVTTLEKKQWKEYRSYQSCIAHTSFTKGLFVRNADFRQNTHVN